MAKEAQQLADNAKNIFKGAICLKSKIKGAVICDCSITESHGNKIQTKMHPIKPKVWYVYWLPYF